MQELQAKIAANIHSFCKTYRNNREYQDARTFLPYAILKAGKGLIVINRNYKPLGVPNGSDVDYESTDFDHLRISESDIDQAGFLYSTATACFFYDDSCPPYRAAEFRRSYLKRIEKCFGMVGDFA